MTVAPELASPVTALASRSPAVLQLRAVLRISPGPGRPDPGDVLAAVRRLTAQWLHPLYGPMSLNPGVHQAGTARLEAAYTFGPDGTEQALRLRLTPDHRTPAERVTVLAHRPDALSPTIVAVSLEADGQRAAPSTPAAQQLLGRLVEGLRPGDGPCPVTSSPLTVPQDHVPVLSRWLTSPDRRLPLLLAAPPTTGDERWERALARLADDCVGRAVLVRLADQSAVEAWRLAVDGQYQVASGSVRLFLPGVDPSSAQDGCRHRRVLPGQLTDPRDRTAFALAGQVQQLSRTALPAELHALPLPLVTPTAALPPRGGSAEEELRGLLDLAELAWQEQRDALQDALTRARVLQDQRDTARAEAEQELADHLETLAQLGGRQDTRAYPGPPANCPAGTPAQAPPAPADVPTSFQELFTRAAQFPYLAVLADTTPSQRLDAHPRRSVWAAKAWLALVSLNDYAQAAANGFRGGFYVFCQNPPADARPYPPKQVAMVEGDQTMNRSRWAEQRCLPVPTEVDPTGYAEMTAHLKLDTGGIAPRIHFLDATASTGRVCVGYIGPHLTNTRT